MTRARRRWVLAPLIPGEGSVVDGFTLRATCLDDDQPLAVLLDQAYVGTVDHDPDADHRTEIETWRRVDGADDEASAVILGDGEFVGACLIGRELGAPFLYDIAVLDQHWGRGVARALLEHARSVLAARSEPHLAAWVTAGNVASEALLSSAGFVPVTPPVEGAVALGYYRAAGAVRAVDPNPSIPLAATLEADGPTLWVIDRDQPDHTISIRDVDVRIRHIAADSIALTDLAARAMPLRHAAWLLDQRPTND